jgi:hypothetical protein
LLNLARDSPANREKCNINVMAVDLSVSFVNYFPYRTT